MVFCKVGMLCIPFVGLEGGGREGTVGQLGRAHGWEIGARLIRRYYRLFPICSNFDLPPDFNFCLPFLFILSSSPPRLRPFPSLSLTRAFSFTLLYPILMNTYMTSDLRNMTDG